MIKNFEQFINESDEKSQDMNLVDYIKNGELTDYVQKSLEMDDNKFEAQVDGFIKHYKDSKYKLENVEIADLYIGFLGNVKCEQLLMKNGLKSDEAAAAFDKLKDFLQKKGLGDSAINDYKEGKMTLNKYLDITIAHDMAMQEYYLYLSRVGYILEKLGFKKQDIQEFIYGKQ